MWAALARVLAQTEPRPWTDIPAVRLLGVVLGAVFLIAAIRAMFGGRR
jgi:hypothetical protein